MSDQIVRLIYPPELLDVPIINQLIRRYDLTFNILRAEVTPREGWVDLQLSGQDSAVESAVTWLSGQGIEIQRLAQ